MKGYLMQEKEWVPGEDLFLESFSPENEFGVVFEDDGDSAYFYAVERDSEGAGLQVLDALHIYEGDGRDGDRGVGRGGEGEGDGDEGDDGGKAARRLLIVWSRDWLKCALVVDVQCHALFDFETHGGYNINEFPPPNEIWTRGERKLTDELVKRLF